MLITILAVCSALTLTFTSGSGLAVASLTQSGIAWSPCPKATGYLCGSLQVPVDYGQPSRGMLPLAVIEHPVSDSKGVIVFNPGGPGESGVLILPILASFVPKSVAASSRWSASMSVAPGRAIRFSVGRPLRPQGAPSLGPRRRPDILWHRPIMSCPISHPLPDRQHHDVGSGHEQSSRGSWG